jgi:hypothetical protein
MKTKKSDAAIKPAGIRCLIIERHRWETGFIREQLQIPLDVAAAFFGGGSASRSIRVRITGAPHPYPCKVTKIHRASRTRRIDGLPFLGMMGPCFIFLEETGEADLYEIWCEYDVAIVAAKFQGWRQAKNSQYGRGRLALIVPGPISRRIDRCD